MDIQRIYLPDLISEYPCETYVEHIFDGSTAVMELWPAERIRALLAALEKLDVTDRGVVYDKLPPCWVIAIAEHALRPARSWHWTKYLGEKDMEILAFPQGEPNPGESGIDFELRESGEDVYVRVIADKPPLKGHNYDPAGYEKTVAPPIPAGKNVYIHADAPTFVILSAERTYAPAAKSVSISFAHDVDQEGHRLYTCCYTTTKEKALGETHPLYPEWDEWPFFLARG